MRVAFAGSNDQPYRSVNQWLLEEGVSKINPWPDATKAWARENPQRLRELLWSNPRYIFFREEALSDFDAGFGPRGAQSVALTQGRRHRRCGRIAATAGWNSRSGLPARLKAMRFLNSRPEFQWACSYQSVNVPQVQGYRNCFSINSNLCPRNMRGWPV